MRIRHYVVERSLISSVSSGAVVSNLDLGRINQSMGMVLEIGSTSAKILNGCRGLQEMLKARRLKIK